MAIHDLSTDDWTEIVAQGDATCRMITVTEGEALVSLGDPEGDGFVFGMSAFGHRQNAIGPFVPVYARATTALATVSVGGVGDNEPAFLAEDQALVSDGDEFEATGGTVTISVAGGVATAEFTADP